MVGRTIIIQVGLGRTPYARWRVFRHFRGIICFRGRVSLFLGGQIGNAVPPAMGKAIYQEIIRVLKETDSVDADGDRDMLLD